MIYKQPQCLFSLLIACSLAILVYFLIPFQARYLILGVDEGFQRNKPGHADSIILFSVTSAESNATMMSIPRDLWLSISEHEENRIGMVYSIAENIKAGSGSTAISTVINENFDLSTPYYAIIKMDGFVNIIDSMGGIDILVTQPTANYPTGVWHLSGQEALAFARDRNETDDFSRMVQVQVLINGVMKQCSKPEIWISLPRILLTIQSNTETNIPFWDRPRLLLALYRAWQSNKIEGYTITRDMVRPVITSQGVQVIEPRWDAIRKLVDEVFYK